MSAAVVPIERAEPGRLDVGEGCSLWYRCWGNPAGTPVLFVHGGPGQCVADYNDINQRFFDAERYWVVEVDQRGTGLSQPSVREDYRHMQRYMDITVEQMSADFERVRTALHIERWLVFGGSWGSCLGLDYALSYPSRCLGLILRGIFLSTVAEFEAIYARQSFLANARRLAEFDTFFELAAQEAARRGEPAGLTCARSATRHHLKAQALPTDPTAPPQQLAGSPWPGQLGSGPLTGEASATLRHQASRRSIRKTRSASCGCTSS